MTGSTEVATRGQKAPSPSAQLKSELEKFAPSFENLLPKGYPTERLITGAMIAATRNPALFDCTKVSIATALATIAQWGLDIGHTAHLVPYGRDCTAVCDYKGLIELMCAAGARKVEAREVREGDDFEYAFGSETFLRHVPLAPSGAKIIAAWAIVTLRGGAQQIEVMTADDIDAIRKAKSKQWKNGELPYWYARKTVVRRLAKYVPRTARLQAALERDEVPLAGIEDLPPEVGAALGSEVPRLRNPRSVEDRGYDADGVVAEPPVREVLDLPGKPKATTLFQDEPDLYEPGDAREDDQ